MTQPPYPGPGPYRRQQPYPQGYQQPYAPPYQQPQAPPEYAQPPAGPYGAPQYAPQQPYSSQQYPGGPQGYQQQPHQAYPPYQQQAGPAMPGMGPLCRLCGSGPAVQATFRGVVGAVVMHTIWTAPGPYCRDCGLHTFRRLTTKSLAGGWAGIGALVVTPIFLLTNHSARGKVAALPAPQRGVGGRAPLDPGPPVFHRPAAYLYPAVVGLLLLAIILANLAA